MSYTIEGIEAELIERNLPTDLAEEIFNNLDGLHCENCSASLDQEIENLVETTPEYKVTCAHIQCTCCGRSSFYYVTSDDDQELTGAITKKDGGFSVDMDGSTISCDQCGNVDNTIKFGYEVDAYVRAETRGKYTVYTEEVGNFEQIQKVTDADIYIGVYPHGKENIYSESCEVSETPFEKISAPDTTEKDQIISALIQQLQQYSDNELVIAKNFQGEEISYSMEKLYEKYCFQPRYTLHPKGNVWEIRYHSTPENSEWIATGKDKNSLSVQVTSYNDNMVGGPSHG